MPNFRSVLLQAHSIVGLAVSVVLAVIGLTGATMSFEDEILDALNASIMHVAPTAAPLLTPDGILAQLKANNVPGKVAGLTLSSDPSKAVHVRFGREDGQRPASVYVDPADGHVLGRATAEEFFATVRRIHRWLLIPGDSKGWGRQVTGIVALGLVVLLLSGLVLRWPRRVRSIRAWLKPNWTMRGRGFQWSLHSVVGTWMLPVYLVIAITGLWYSFDWYRDGATWLLSSRAKAPAMQPKQPRAPRTAATEAGPLTLDHAWAVFLRQQGNRYATAQLQLPVGGATVMRIRSIPIGATREGQRDEFRIDVVTGTVQSASIYADKASGDKVLSSVLDIHRGIVFGTPGRILFMLAASLMPLFTVTGFLLYFSRRKLRPAKPGAVPAGPLVAGE
ncbi:PepSY-associated TM helix domain-containing protein [soil metagenome]